MWPKETRLCRDIVREVVGWTAEKGTIHSERWLTEEDLEGD